MTMMIKNQRSDKKFPLLHLKTKKVEITIGPSMIGVIVALAGAGFHLDGSVLGFLAGSCVVLVGASRFARLFRWG